jgi:hypothetical protein
VDGARRAVARTRAELAEVSALIHDADFDADRIDFDEAAARIVVRFAQERGGAPPEPPLRRTWLYDEYRVPFHAGTLTIEHVSGACFPKRFGAMEMLVGVDYDEGRRRLRLDAYDVVDIAVERLEVSAELTDAVAFEVRRRRYRLASAERDRRA